MAQVRQGIAARAGTTRQPVRPINFAPCWRRLCPPLGHPEDGLQALAEAHTLGAADETLLGSGVVSPPDASCASRGRRRLRRNLVERALDIARRQEAKALEPGARASSRLWQQPGQAHEARHYWHQIYGWLPKA